MPDAPSADPVVLGDHVHDSDADHHVYIVECADGTLYTGYTTDVRRRVSEHNDGTGAKYTRGRTPVRLRYLESYRSRSDAMSREYAIKALTRSAKRALFEDI
ncbi:GIY-YIG nuclease family protein [Halorubrum vacuolatum]|uniref:GIY-YIG nuclease family protein n=1 Tax=Halorubrum vacuolatum TaxID=63740 RepID=UPI001FEB9135|nr:GIY-YIG nuclease family protein [Halorubrum vacuolatum]